MTDQNTGSEEGTLPAILDKMNEIAKHGFDYFLIVVGFVLLFTGVIAPPAGFMSKEELLIVTASGILCFAGGIWVWRQKANLKFRLYEVQANLFPKPPEIK